MKLKATLALSLLFTGCLVGKAEQPKPEYPRPQFERDTWINLNGPWTYTFDFGKSGLERGLSRSKGFNESIIVPFCPESSLSGVEHTDFINAMWYHKKLDIPTEWNDCHIMLNFGGVDYRATIFIDSKEVAEHYGGSASFSLDIADYVTPGKSSDLVVYVEDDVRSGYQTGGKQSRRHDSYECFYTRVTGIWQTVWLEPIAKGALKSVRITPDLDNSQFVFQPTFMDLDRDVTLEVSLVDNDKEIFSKKVYGSNQAHIVAKVKNPKLWSPENPYLYDVKFTVYDRDGKIIDEVKSYTGMRKTEVRGNEFYLNNKPYYQRLVLDQGYYPDGQWTSPNDEQLRRDIELGKACGFNGARLHQKVFEPRYYYWADKLGYLTWGESASWDVNWTDRIAARNMLMEWEECVDRDYNVVSLIAWSPLNETWKPDEDKQRARLSNDLFFATHRLDNTRPVVTVSGGYHAGNTDIYTEHTYTQDPVELFNELKLKNGVPYIQAPAHSVPYKGQCYMLDEFGGIKWMKEMAAKEVAPESAFWGYGAPPTSLEEFYKRLEEQVNVVLATDYINGFCYTQIVDVELEKNGIFTYDRAPKFDIKRIHDIFSKPREQARREVEDMLNKRATVSAAE